MGMSSRGYFISSLTVIGERLGNPFVSAWPGPRSDNSFVDVLQFCCSSGVVSKNLGSIPFGLVMSLNSQSPETWNDVGCQLRVFFSRLCGHNEEAIWRPPSAYIHEPIHSAFATASSSSQVVLRRARLVPSLTVAIILSETRISPKSWETICSNQSWSSFHSQIMRESG